MSKPHSKRLWILSTFTAVALTGIAVVLHSDADPQVTIPSLPLPKPNAFDYDIAAGKALRNSLKISEASSEVSKAGGIPSSALSADKALIQENDALLRQVRAGFAFSYVGPQQRVENPVSPNLAQFRGIAELLALDARLRAVDQDWNGAANSAMDAIRLGEDMPHGGAEIDWLVGVNCQALGRKPLWTFVPHLTSAQARSAANRLETIQARHTPYSDVMQEEEWTGQASLLATFRQRDWREAMTKDTFDGSGIIDDSSQTKRAEFRLLLSAMSKQAVFDEWTHYMNAVVHSARAPYAAKIPIPHLPLDPEHALGYSVFLIDPYKSQQIRDTDSETQNALLTVALALQAYSSEHENLPEFLDALVPSYLNHIPADPFALSGPLRYQRQGKTYVLYSVGPDGKDDHGAPIADTSQAVPASPGASDRRHFVRDDSRGDVVAGINL